MDNAPLHFLTRYPAASDTTDSTTPSSSSSSDVGVSEGCGSSVTVLLEGVRPQPVEIQALCSLRDRQSDDSSSSSSSSAAAAAAAAVGGDDSDDSAGGDENNSDEYEPSSREDGGAPFYAFKNAIGLKDRQRLSMLTTILSEHTAIKVRSKNNGGISSGSCIVLAEESYPVN